MVSQQWSRNGVSPHVRDIQKGFPLPGSVGSHKADTTLQRQEDSSWSLLFTLTESFLVGLLQSLLPTLPTVSVTCSLVLQKAAEGSLQSAKQILPPLPLSRGQSMPSAFQQA